MIRPYDFETTQGRSHVAVAFLSDSFQTQHGLNTVQIFSVANAVKSVDLNYFLPRFIFICVPKEASFAFKCYRSTY